MPQRKRKRSYRSKSRPTYKKRRWTPSPYNRVGGNAVVGLPTGMRVQMKYSTRVDLTSAVLSTVENVFRAFSIFDPDYTGVGHQPLGHDQWANLYKRYRVLGSKIDAHFSRTDAPAATNYQNQCVLALTEQSALVSGSDLLAEYPVSRSTILGNDGGTKYLSLGYTPAWKFKGEPGVAFEADYSADFGNNPTRDSYYHILMSHGGFGSCDGRANIVITYDVWIYDPVDLASS